MSDFNEECKFKYKLRDYQQRALDEIHKYMKDNKINIVASPGAGKTILALQLMLEIGNPTLICVPSIALREQWIQRFKEGFSNVDESIISDDLFNPKTLTVCTYQAINSAFRMKKDSEDESNADNNKKIKIIDLLKQERISTVILDEAHHLKKTWWNSLIKMLNSLENIKTISLTATPPYDVANKEWENYIEVCGEIDAEITIPELVEKGDLCPHQDYIYLNYLEKDDVAEIQKQREEIDELCEKICNNTEFITAISLNPGLICLDEKIDMFLERFDYYLSILSFLKFKQINIAFDEINIDLNNIPSFNIKQLEILLDGCLFFDKNSYKNFDKLFKEIKKELNQFGIIEESHVNLVYGKEIKDIISQNRGKLDSINKIIENECKSMKNTLKLVIITDYIREDIYDIEEFAKVKTIGVIPIFENIRRSLKEKVSTIVLTGKIVIIPTKITQDLINICEEEEIDTSLISIQELTHDFDYSKVVFNGGSQKSMVHIITKLFEISSAQILIGTSALIGEGWDAPFINSLILASFVGSFVLSNQMRGRAIRVSKTEKNKTSNIWHLACVEQGNEENKYALGTDFETLRRRFNGFNGISLDENKIDYGINRLGFTDEMIDITKEQIDSINNKMLMKANNREEMTNIWKQSLVDYVPIRKCRIPKEDCTIGKYSKYIRLKKHNNVLINYMINVYNKIIDINSLHNIKKISSATVETLYTMNVISKQYMFSVRKDSSDVVTYLKDSSIKENSIFDSCMREFLSEIHNPRYLIKIKNRYFNVPQIIAKRKEDVIIFKKNIEKRFFVKTEIMYTKTPENKRKLLQIRVNEQGGAIYQIFNFK